MLYPVKDQTRINVLPIIIPDIWTSDWDLNRRRAMYYRTWMVLHICSYWYFEAVRGYDAMVARFSRARAHTHTLTSSYTDGGGTQTAVSHVVRVRHVQVLSYFIRDRRLVNLWGLSRATYKTWGGFVYRKERQKPPVNISAMHYFLQAQTCMWARTHSHS